MQLLLIDNYDSFTYNLLHLVREVCESADRIVVVPNDRISAMEAITTASCSLRGPASPPRREPCSMW